MIKQIKKFLLCLSAIAVIFTTHIVTANAASDFDSYFKGTSEPSGTVTVESDGSVESDTDVSGVLKYTNEQSDFLDLLSLRIRNNVPENAQSTSYTTIGVDNYVDFTVTLPTGFTGTFTDKSDATLLTTEVISGNGTNVLTIRISFKGGEDPTRLTMAEVRHKYGMNSFDPVGFEIAYTGTALQGTPSDAYTAVFNTGNRTVSFGTYSRDVAISGPELSLITTKEKDDDVTPGSSTVTGDMLINGETQNASAYEAKVGSTNDIKFTYTTAQIKSEVANKLEHAREVFGLTTEQFQGIGFLDYQRLSLEFEAILELPEGLSFAETPAADNISFTGGTDMFSVSDVTVSGNTAVVTMSLDGDSIYTTKQLQDAIDALASEISISVKVKVNDDATENQEYQIKGILESEFVAHPGYVWTTQENDMIIEQTWTALQLEIGRDSTLPYDSNDITVTIKAIADATPTPTPAPTATPTPTPTATPTATPEPTAVAYEIIQGNGQTLTKGSNGIFVSNAPFEKFTSVMVDGAVVGTENYTAVSGSTKVEFKGTYTNTLAIGSHTIEIVSNDGTARGTFKIQQASTTTPTTPVQVPVVNTGVTE